MERPSLSIPGTRRRQVLVSITGSIAVGILLLLVVKGSDSAGTPVTAVPTAQVARQDLTATVALAGRLEPTDTRAIYWQQPAPAPVSDVSVSEASSTGASVGGTARGQAVPASVSAANAGQPAPPRPTSSLPPSPPTSPPAPTSTTTPSPPSSVPPPTSTTTSTTSTTLPPSTTTTAPTTSVPSTPSTTTAGTGSSSVPIQTVPVSSATATSPQQTAPTQTAPESGGTAGEDSAGEDSAGEDTGGTLTAIAAASQQLTAGDVLFAIDSRPTVLMIGADAAYRDLEPGVEEGADVTQLEENLVGLGFDADGTLLVDQTFDTATAAAVEDWQESLGVEATGVVELGDAVFLPDPGTVTATNAVVGDAVQPGAHLLDVTGEALLAVGDIPVRLRGEVAEGSAATVTLADGTTVTGTVLAVGDDATREAETPVADSTVELTVQLDATDSAAAVDFADVTLSVVTVSREDVPTVPVAAIVDGGDGQPAVRVPSESGSSSDGDPDAVLSGDAPDGSSGSTQLVAFEPGLSAGGFVEVLDGALPEGAIVLLPGP